MFRFSSLLCIILTFHLLGAELQPDLTVAIPMTDGTALPTDLYFPKGGNPAACPCILLRSPAGKNNPFAVRYTSLSNEGYVVAIQATRSAEDSTGRTFPGWSDGWVNERDGYDTVEWLGKSSFCNGKIGTCGVSALGITQLLLAPSAPPSLKCQFIGVAPGSLFHHAVCPGGQFVKEQVEGWLRLYAPDSGVQSYAASHLFYNEFWDRFNTMKVAEKVTVPAVHYGGWYDTFLQGTIDGYVARQEKGAPGARETQKLVIGPWTHFWPVTLHLGDFKVPENARELPHGLSEKTWFDFHLKGIANGMDALPPVTYYVMGPFDTAASEGNVWRTADRWPVPSEPLALYLTEGGSLAEDVVSARHKVLHFQHDPHDPVPTLGGRNLFLGAGPKDQREIERRDDVLVFTSPPLEEAVEVTGRVLLKLFFTSSHMDTDVVAKLTDVYPDGRSILIAEGIFRTGGQLASDADAGAEPQEIEVDLWSTSLVFAKGHRIRILVTGSNFPRYEVNYNVGYFGAYSGDYAVARNQIHIGKRYPSRLILPLIRTVK